MIIPVVIIVSLTVFLLLELVPGDLAAKALGDFATPEALERFREEHGLNDPLFVQYFNYMRGVATGNLGNSFYNNIDVWDLYFMRLPYTVLLALTSSIFAVVLSIPLGIWAALKRGSLIDTGASVISFFGIAMPNFWVGLMLVALLSVHFELLPAVVIGGRITFQNAIIPTITMGTGLMGAITRTTRSAMLDVVYQDYLRTARAKGLPEKKVIRKHALGNAWIPIVTMIGTQTAVLLGGSVITETIFAWPGVGFTIVDAMLLNDYPVVLGFIIMTAIFTSLIILLIDILYAFLDPRIKAEYAR